MGGDGSNRRKGAAAEELVLTIASTHDQGHKVQEQILDSAQRHGFAGQPFFALKLALEEALVNAIKHGNRLDAEKKVHIKASISDERIRITIEDEGPGFKRKAVPDPTAEENLEKCSGRGILLMEAYMTSVRWDRGGRRIRLLLEKEGQ